MTICIAAACNASRDGGTKIVLCADWLQSSGLGSAETIHKQAWLPGNLVCLTAGDVTEINALVRVLRTHFKALDEIDETNIIPTVRGALHARLAEKRDEFAIGQFGYGYDEVFRFGRDRLPDAVFAKFILDTSRIDLRTQCIIAGFVRGDDFLIETTQHAEIRLPSHFSCVGSGALLAKSALLQRSYRRTDDFGPALYQVYEAKRTAENEVGVGKSTLIMVLNEDGAHRNFKIDSLDYLDNLYRKYGPQLVPILMDVPDELFW